MPEEGRREWLDFVMRFQQLTGPVMAKGVEDTAFYVYNRLVSLNEVGGSPDQFGLEVTEFHRHNVNRQRFWPHALIATSTHDSKRSEDVRARINVLSEIPEEWRRCVRKWSLINRRKRVGVDGSYVPDPNDEYLLYQTLIGVWPPEGADDAGYQTLSGRIKDYMIKAIREAKVNTSWINPRTTYENGLKQFIDAILTRKAGNSFLRDFEQFEKRVSRCGMINSLSQVVLKVMSPGVPDFYQGTELWHYCLVDPDNRQPVDYEVRERMLRELKGLERELPVVPSGRGRWHGQDARQPRRQRQPPVPELPPARGRRGGCQPAGEGSRRVVGLRERDGRQDQPPGRWPGELSHVPRTGDWRRR